jgi:hypothetical protein
MQTGRARLGRNRAVLTLRNEEHYAIRGIRQQSGNAAQRCLIIGAFEDRQLGEQALAVDRAQRER